MTAKAAAKGRDFIPIEPDAYLPAGTLVRVPAGIQIFSTDPRGNEGVTQRARLVRLPVPSSMVDVMLTWAGNGGYWKRAHKANCAYIPNSHKDPEACDPRNKR